MPFYLFHRDYPREISPCKHFFCISIAGLKQSPEHGQITGVEGLVLFILAEKEIPFIHDPENLSSPVMPDHVQ